MLCYLVPCLCFTCTASPHRSTTAPLIPVQVYLATDGTAEDVAKVSKDLLSYNITVFRHTDDSAAASGAAADGEQKAARGAQLAVVEQLACAGAAAMIGTKGSTFSHQIYYERRQQRGLGWQGTTFALTGDKAIPICEDRKDRSNCEVWFQ